MTIKKYFAVAITLVLIISCAEDSSKVSKLDKQNGFQGLVLGDSTYSSFMEKVRSEASSSDIIEREIFGNVIVPFQKIENLDHRFIYGVLMDNLYASSLNGKVYSYTLFNTDLDSTAQNKLLDSLTANYGSPTSLKDSTNSSGNSGYERNWKGKNVELIYRWVKNDFTSLNISDKNAIETFKDIGRKINSLKNDPPDNLANLQSIGDLNLNSTKQELLKNDALTIDELEISEDYTITDYIIDYETYLESFFDIKNRNKYRYVDSKIISNELEFDDSSDSLKTVTVTFDDTDNGSSYSSKEVSYSSLLNLLGAKFGEYSFEEKLHTKEDVLRRAFWLSNNLIIELENKSYNEVDIVFYVNYTPNKLQFQ